MSYIWDGLRNRACISSHTGIMLGLFEPEYGGDMFLQKVSWLPMDYIALYDIITVVKTYNSMNHHTE
jgi:hypothetical protein